MPKSHKSKALGALHETMSDLHRAGAIDGTTMREFDERCLERPAIGRGKAANRLSFQVFKDSKKEWRWRLLAGNGKLIADSGEGYKSKGACLAAIELVKQSAMAPIAV